MARKVMEDEQSKLVEKLVHQANKPANHLTLNQYRILFEKCVHTSHRVWTSLEILIPLLIAIIGMPMLMNKISDQNQNLTKLVQDDTATTQHRLSEYEITMRYPFPKNFFIVDSTANLELVNEFLEYVQRGFSHCYLHNSLNFIKVNSTKDIDFTKDSLALTLKFDHRFTKKELIYGLFKPNVNGISLSKPWLNDNEISKLNEFSLYSQMHFTLSASFYYWGTNVPFNFPCPKFRFEDLPLHLPGPKPVNLNVLGYFGTYFLVVYFLPALAFLNYVARESNDKSKEFLRLMGASNIQICITNILFYFTKALGLFVGIAAVFHYGDVWDSLSFWTVSAMLLQLTVGTGVYAQLISVIVPHLNLGRLLFFGLYLVACLSNFMPNNWMILVFTYPGPFYSFYVNFQLATLALANDGAPARLLESNSQFWNLSWATSYLLSWAFIALNFLLLLYFTECWPFGQHGNIRPFHYIFHLDYWIPSRAIRKPIDALPPPGPRFELAPNHPIINIRNLKKSYRAGPPNFKLSTVIENLNFDFYDNQITALLGFNGAGKTTLIDMMTGMKTIDQGQIQVSGKDVQSETNLVRTYLGFCPQQNLFYQRLTVGQNLRLAAAMKGISLDDADEQVEIAGALLTLTTKLNQPAESLSGGMKRRLCLGCAILGNWKVLILDEPTSGLDPETRRDIWDLLLLIRKFRTIILTTHFMEEADVLADRIAIMSKGDILCSGSASFLKRVYQTGYMLTLQLNTGANQSTVFDGIHNFVPQAFIAGKKTDELTVQLLGSSGQTKEMFNSSIISLFQWLEKEQELVQNFSLSNTSLEDVFLKIGKEKEEMENAKSVNGEHKQNGILNPAFDDINQVEEIGNADSILIFDSPKKNNHNISNALFYKRFCYLGGHLFGTLRLILVPILLGWLLSFIQNTTLHNLTKETPSQNLLFEFNQSYSNVKALYARDNTQPDAFMQEFATKAQQIYGVNPEFLSVTENQNEIDDRIRKYVTDNANVREFAYAISFDAKGIKLWPNPIYHYNIPAIYSILWSNEIDPQLQQSPNLIKMTLQLDHFNKPSLYTYDSYARISELGAIFTLFLLFAYLATHLFEIPTEELKRDAVFMQQVAGIDKVSYWTINFAFDYGQFILAFTLYTLTFGLFDKSDIFIMGFDVLDFLAIIFSGYTFVGVCYLWVRIMSHSKWLVMGSNVYMLISFLIGVWYSMAPQMFYVKQFYRLVLFTLFPVTNIIESFNRFQVIGSYELCKAAQLQNCKKIKSDALVFGEEGDYSNFYVSLVMALITVLNLSHDKFAIFLYGIISNVYQGLFSTRMFSEGTGARHPVKLDEAIISEKKEIKEIVSTGNFEDNILVASSLTKRFGGKVAVDDISFKIRKEECFGLLGLNGAGKSTTFQILTGAIPFNAGELYLNGKRLTSDNYKKAYETISYCPQTESNFPGLTVVQTLSFYLKAKGAPSASLTRISKRIIELTDLQEYSDSMADNLSGGNKRKLALAISLVGVPKLVLLDEPTTGVDPIARRKLWSCLNLHRKIGRCTYLLTSHSMDECEFLCDRIAIMANGKIRCVGTASELKQNYAQGFKITLKLAYRYLHDEEYQNNLKAKLSACFPGKITFHELHMNTMDFLLNDSNVKWGELFTRLQELNEEIKLDDFIVTATTMEQVFLSFKD